MGKFVDLESLPAARLARNLQIDLIESNQIIESSNHLRARIAHSIDGKLVVDAHVGVPVLAEGL